MNVGRLVVLAMMALSASIARSERANQFMISVSSGENLNDGGADTMGGQFSIGLQAIITDVIFMDVIES